MYLSDAEMRRKILIHSFHDKKREKADDQAVSVAAMLDKKFVKYRPPQRVGRRR